MKDTYIFILMTNNKKILLGHVEGVEVWHQKSKDFGWQSYSTNK
jgi:hypothetical protein